MNVWTSQIWNGMVNTCPRKLTSFYSSEVKFVLFFLTSQWRCGPTRAVASSFLRFLDHTQWRITVGRTPLDEWSARRRDLYLTIHNIHNRQISISPVGFEPTISAGERSQTYALYRAATGTGKVCPVQAIKTYGCGCIHSFSAWTSTLSRYEWSGASPPHGGRAPIAWEVG